jgi:hypothetical protein
MHGIMEKKTVNIFFINVYFRSFRLLHCVINLLIILNFYWRPSLLKILVSLSYKIISKEKISLSCSVDI